MNPTCPRCKSDLGFDRQPAPPVKSDGRSISPEMDLVFCRNCGYVITALIPYDLQLAIDEHLK